MNGLPVQIWHLSSPKLVILPLSQSVMTKPLTAAMRERASGAVFIVAVCVERCWVSVNRLEGSCLEVLEEAGRTEGRRGESFNLMMFAGWLDNEFEADEEKQFQEGVELPFIPSVST